MPFGVQVLNSVYFPNNSFLQAKRKRNDSWVWASLVHGKETLLQHARWLIGRGDKICIKDSNWLGTGERIQGELPAGMGKVEDLIDHQNSCWNIQTIRSIFDQQTVMKILQTPIQWLENEDSIWWPYTRSREYSVKSGYWRIKENEQSAEMGGPLPDSVDQRIWSRIWGAYIPQKKCLYGSSATTYYQ